MSSYTFNQNHVLTDLGFRLMSKMNLHILLLQCLMRPLRNQSIQQQKHSWKTSRLVSIFLYIMHSEIIDIFLPVQDTEESTLPHALTNLINTTHVLEIKTHTYYEHATFESFTCNKIYPALISTIHSSTQDVQDIDNTLSEDPSGDFPKVQKNSLKRLKRGPTISTPSKSSEKKKRTM